MKLSEYPDALKSRPCFLARKSVLAASLVAFGALCFSGCSRDTTASSAAQNAAMTVARQVETPPSARAKLGLHTRKTWMEFITQPRQLQANSFSIWLVNVWQSGKTATRSRNRVPDYQMVRNRLMHLIIVADDLSYFQRVNPDHKGNGHFMIEQTLPRAGKFKLFADYTPVDETREVAQKTFVVEGGRSPRAALTVDKFVNSNTTEKAATKRVSSKAENEPDALGGDTYNVRLSLPKKVVVGRGIEMRFRVMNEQGAALADLEPYLGAFGQAVVLSGDGAIFLDVRRDDETSVPISYANEVAPDDSTDTRRGGPEVAFRATFPTSGLYKIWAQFRHRNRVITAPFVFEVSPEKSR